MSNRNELTRFILKLGAVMGSIALLATIVFLLIQWTRRVEVVVPAPSSEIMSAVLSPERDKLFYSIGSEGKLVLNLISNTTLNIEAICQGYAWIDNNTVLCWWARILVDVRDGSTLNVRQINFQEEVIDWEALITDNHKVYELADGWDDHRVFVLLAQNPEIQSYYVYLVPEEVQLPSNIEITLIPKNLDIPIDHTSPNGEYHFRQSEDEWLRIYDKQDNILTEVSFDGNTKVIGWTYDSSGVLFLQNAGFLDPRKFPIKKLVVP